MNFKRALSELREKYGDSAALTYTVTIHDGIEHVSIYAMGNDKCALASHYRDAIDALDRLFKSEHHTSEAPDEETEDKK